MPEILARPAYTRSVLKVGTLVHLKVVTEAPEADAQAAMSRALDAFDRVERACSRFDETSELRRLSATTGIAVPVSDLLFEVLRFAWTVADMTDGLFDPTMGRVLKRRGFDRHYLTGDVVADESDEPGAVTFRDIELDETARTVLLHRPLTLDLGAVAKGFAIDLAAHELASFGGCVIDAGGDVYVGGLNELGEPWHIGIRHPVQRDETIASIQTSNAAVCTSGSYERVSPHDPNAHHLIDPHSGQSPRQLWSSTVMAPFAMMADAFSTVTFLLGSKAGIDMLNEIELNGLLVDASLALHMTPGMKEYLHGEA